MLPSCYEQYRSFCKVAHHCPAVYQRHRNTQVRARAPVQNCKTACQVIVTWLYMISRRIRGNYAATPGEPIRREAAAGACFSFNQLATSSGSKRTDPEIRNDGMLPLEARMVAKQELIRFLPVASRLAPNRRRRNGWFG